MEMEGKHVIGTNESLGLQMLGTELKHRKLEKLYQALDKIEGHFYSIRI